MLNQCLVALLVFSLAWSVQTVEPIWLSPTDTNYNVPEDTAEQFPERGVWSNISVGAGGRRGSPLFLMDSKQIFWIMFGLPSSFQTVWNYDPKTDLYRWVAGPGNDTAVRRPGQLRVPDESNAPGGVYYTIATMDLTDNIWFMTSQYCCEFWMFNTTSKLFARMQGQAGVTTGPNYGTPGQPGDTVFPAGALQTACFVPDSRNNFWMLSGISNNEPINHVWHFNTTSLQWTFISGNTTRVSTRYGADPFYGGRQAPCCDIDANDRVWLFGGLATNEGYFSDMWSYDTRTMTWRLEQGSAASKGNEANIASYNFHPDNVPAAREFASLVDRKDGTLMVACGKGSNFPNDVWLFDKTSKYWKLVYGNLAQSNNGTYSHYRSPGSVMPSRTRQGLAKGSNTKGDLFLYAGMNDNSYTLKDIWVIPQDQCAHPELYSCPAQHSHCVEEIVGYSCACDEDYEGDGVTCTAIPVPVSPVSVTPQAQQPVQDTPVVQPSTDNAPKTKSVVASGVRVVGSTLLTLLYLAISTVA